MHYACVFFHNLLDDVFEEKCSNLETYSMDISRNQSLEVVFLVSMSCHGHSIVMTSLERHWDTETIIIWVPEDDVKTHQQGIVNEIVAGYT